MREATRRSSLTITVSILHRLFLSANRGAVITTEAVDRASPSVAVVSHTVRGLSRGLGPLWRALRKLVGGAGPSVTCPVRCAPPFACKASGITTQTGTAPRRTPSLKPLTNRGHGDTSKEVLYKLRGDSSNGSRRGGHFTVTTDTISN